MNIHFQIQVEADAGGLTFAHEVGHLMGCRHDSDNRTPNGTGINKLPPNLDLISKGHSWYKRNCFFCRKKYRKSVVASGTTRGSRRQFFSNPAVKADSKARDNTGTNERNNYRQLLNAAPVVANYNSFEELLAWINGPQIVQVGDLYNLSANTRNCSGGASYKWERSYDGFNYSTISTSSSISERAYPNDGNSVYYRLKVTCSDGQTKTAFTSVYIEDGSGGPLFAKSIDPNKVSEITNNDIIEEKLLVYPNPANIELNVSATFKSKSKIQIKMINLVNGGKSKTIYKGNSVLGINNIKIDVSNLNQGLYQFILFESGKRKASKKIIISR